MDSGLRHDISHQRYLAFFLEDSGRFFAWEWFNNIKTYNIGRHVKFIDYIKYYQQPLSKLARSTDPTEKKRISSLF